MVLVITGTDRSVISYKYKLFDIIQVRESHPKFIKIKIVSEQAMTNVKYEIRL